jgi:hypothetical protein
VHPFDLAARDSVLPICFLSSARVAVWTRCITNSIFPLRFLLSVAVHRFLLEFSALNHVSRGDFWAPVRSHVFLAQGPIVPGFPVWFSSSFISACTGLLVFQLPRLQFLRSRFDLRPTVPAACSFSSSRVGSAPVSIFGRLCSSARCRSAVGFLLPTVPALPGLSLPSAADLIVLISPIWSLILGLYRVVLFWWVLVLAHDKHSTKCF